jgi:rod shape-determining protein MreD
LFTVLQSTVLRKISIAGVTPDLALIVLVFTANSSGAFKGEGLGFVSGIIQDLVSTGPLGFNALIRTIVGFIYGKLKGKLFLDTILLPALFIISATVIKEALSSLTVLLMMSGTSINFFDKAFLIELGLNTFFAPFIFALLKLLKLYKAHEQDGF